jgi:hypothetical protein
MGGRVLAADISNHSRRIEVVVEETGGYQTLQTGNESWRSQVGRHTIAESPEVQTAVPLT